MFRRKSITKTVLSLLNLWKKKVLCSSEKVKFKASTHTLHNQTKNINMDSSPSSNQSITDKPDELVSSADVHSNGPQGSTVFNIQPNAQQQQQQPSPPPNSLTNQQQQKKCLHQRMFDTNNGGNALNERVAALTHAVLQRVNPPTQSQMQAISLSQMIQVSIE